MEFKKTKIICTIGPASSDPKILKKLIENGMDVARLNFSHGTHEERLQQIKDIRDIAKSLGKPVAIMADLQGPKLRLGKINGTINIEKDQIVTFTKNPKNGEIPLQVDVSKYLKPGQRIYLNDGLFKLTVISIKEGVIRAKANNDGWVSSFKGINIPDTTLTGSSFTNKDRKDATFALNQKVDFIALSFVQRPEDLKPAKKIIEEIYSKAKIIAKIEKPAAVENIESIANEAYALLVARGDLAIETSDSQVPVLQQKIIRVARHFQKPVIIATQMLESMTQNPAPTRAEASDVAHAVLDQVDAVMLSAESAYGKYPVEATKFMNETILTVEANPEFKLNIEVNWENISEEHVGFHAILSSAELLAQRISAKIIAVASRSGRAARIISSFRPHERIVAFVHDETTQRQINLAWGVNPVIIKPDGTLDQFWKEMARILLEGKFAEKGDKAVLVAGSMIGLSGATDTIRVIEL